MNKLFKEGFRIKSKTGIEINIPINAKVTIITGDSATGKTKMIKQLNDLLGTNEIIESTVNKEQIEVIKDLAEFKRLYSMNIDNKIIFIDKFDLTDFKVSIPFIEESNNLFVLCAHRSLPECGWEEDSILEMHHDGKIYNLTKFKYAS